MKKAARKNDACTRLPAELGIRQVAALRDEWLALPAGKLRVDAAAVESADAAGLQLLAAFCRDRGPQGIDWESVGDVLRDAARILQLECCLQLPPTKALMRTA